MTDTTIESVLLNPKPLLTPKELADAIGASESSLRRWVDNGDIRISRTAGGHRRIPLPEAIQFIRKIGATVVRPDVLGLGTVRLELVPSGESDEEKLFQALKAGDRGLARGMIINWYLNGQNLPALFDGPIRAAMHRLGELWSHDVRGILQEHWATEICIEAIGTIRGMLPPPPENAPLAIGGAPEGDPYQIPSMMAAAILTEAGFQTVNFGANTPVELLTIDSIERGAGLVWVSVCATTDFKSLRAKLKKLAATLEKEKIDLLVGGRFNTDAAPKSMPNVRLVESMAELSQIAVAMKSGRTASRA